MVAQPIWQALAVLLAAGLIAESFYLFTSRRGMSRALEQHARAREQEAALARARQEERERLLGNVGALLRLVEDLQRKLCGHGQGSQAWYETIGTCVAFIDPWSIRLEAELSALARALAILMQAEGIAPCDVEGCAGWLEVVAVRVTSWEREVPNRVFFSPATLCEALGAATECWTAILTCFDVPRKTAVGLLAEMFRECLEQYQQGLRTTQALLDGQRPPWKPSRASASRCPGGPRARRSPSWWLPPARPVSSLSISPAPSSGFCPSSPPNWSAERSMTSAPCMEPISGRGALSCCRCSASLW
jgi:hypothetical protein